MITSLDRFTIKEVIKIIYILKKRSVLNRSSRHGTIPYYPKSELVPYSDVHCSDLVPIRVGIGFVKSK